MCCRLAVLIGYVVIMVIVLNYCFLFGKIMMNTLFGAERRPALLKNKYRIGRETARSLVKHLNMWYAQKKVFWLLSNDSSLVIYSDGMFVLYTQ